MPSGAKKRKAAKKKKENQPGNNPNPSSDASSTHAHDGDDGKHQDDKESDVGEVSSPASQDHHSQHHLLTEGEEEETEETDKASNLPHSEGVKVEVADERNIVVEGTAIPVESEFKIEGESNKKNGRFEHDEPARKSYDGGSSGSSSSRSSSSSSSSSDDESHGIKINQAPFDAAPVVDSVKVADSFSEEHVQAIESINVEAASGSIVENVPPVVSEKILPLNEKVELEISSPATVSEVPLVESVFKENGEKKRGSVEDQVGISEACKDGASQREEAIIPSPVNVAQETDDRLSLSYNAPIATADNGGDANKELGVTEPLLPCAPRPVQTTSWKSCCGLFELFTGPDR